MTRPLRDQEQREIIRTALDQNLLVEAGAGAGKTYALIERMVHTVKAGKASVDRMAAITFTRKAAGEMRARFDARLREEVRGARGAERECLEQARAQIDRCFIGTIHSFCGRLLRERPMEAGLPPDFTEVEPREAVELRRAAWDRFVQQQYTDGDSRLDQLEKLGVRTEDLFRFFVRRNTFRDIPLKEMATPRPDLQPAVERATAFVGEVEQHIPADPPKGHDDLMESVVQACHFLEHHGIHGDHDRVRFLRFLAGEPSVKVTYWGEHRDFATALRDKRLSDFNATVLEPALKQWRQFVYRHVADFVDDAVAFYRAWRVERGQLTFQDLLLRCAGLLRDHPEVRRYFQQRYHRLFVDEFQDTDPVQARVLLYLAGTDPTEHDWRQLEPQPGRLFLVGDAKQSIYRFRRADLDTFRFVKKRIEETGGQVVRLNTSFRSLGAFCDWANRTFPAIFDRCDSDYQAAFGPLFKFRPEGQDEHGVRALPLDKVPRNRHEGIVKQDAARIADFIAAACAGETSFNACEEGAVLDAEASPSDFMILTRTKGPLSHYARALEERGLPYDIVGGGNLGTSEELRAFVEMLEAVHEPENPIPLIGYLRGPLVGLGDDELYAFKQAGGAFQVQEPLPDGLPNPTHERMHRALERLRVAERDLCTHPPATAFERILARLRLAPFAAAQPMGSSRAGNLMRVLALVRRWSQQGWHWGEVLTELRELIDDDDYEVEEMTLKTGQTDVVRIMNVHQAKGLQAPVVFLADPYNRHARDHEVDAHVSRVGDRPYLSMPVRRSKGPYGSEVIAEPEGWEEDAAEEERFLTAEEDRLLYVAATRARNLLVVSQYAPKPDDGPWSNLYPALDEVPELPACEAPPPTAPDVAMPDGAKQRDQRVARMEAVQRPTSKLRTVSGERPEYSMRGRWARARHRDYDQLIHELFELAVQDRLPEDEVAYIRALVDEADELEARHADAAKNALEQFRASDVWTEAQMAEAVYTGVPFAGKEDESDLSATLIGQIDLVYLRDDGWHVVDYQTDEASTPDEIGMLRTRGAQLQTYARQWTQITGEEVVDISLWLTALGRRVAC